MYVFQTICRVLIAQSGNFSLRETKQASQFTFRSYKAIRIQKLKGKLKPGTHSQFHFKTLFGADARNVRLLWLVHLGCFLSQS